MEYLKLNNDVEMPIEGLGTFLMTPTCLLYTSDAADE